MPGFTRRIGVAAMALALFGAGAGQARADLVVDFSGTLSLAGGSLQGFNGASFTGDFVLSGSLPIDGSTTITSYNFLITETNHATISGSSSQPGASESIDFGEKFAGYEGGTVPLDVVNIGIGGTLSFSLDFLSPIDSTDPQIISFSGAHDSTYNYNGYADGYISQAAPEPGSLTLAATGTLMVLGFVCRRRAVRPTRDTSRGQE